VRVINKDDQVVEDNWQMPDVSEGSLIAEDVDAIISLDYWLANKTRLEGHRGRLGLCISGDVQLEDIVDELRRFPLIALEFPAFKDGRCYSLARLLRERYQYQGELRAVGDILRDQLYYLRRCGVDSFLVREDKDIEDALQGLYDFTVTYQTAADGAVPVYKNR
jgi:uncharacterized protein (DUF934 family)